MCVCDNKMKESMKREAFIVAHDSCLAPLRHITEMNGFCVRVEWNKLRCQSSWKFNCVANIRSQAQNDLSQLLATVNTAPSWATFFPCQIFIYQNEKCSRWMEASERKLSYTIFRWFFQSYDTCFITETRLWAGVIFQSHKLMIYWTINYSAIMKRKIFYDFLCFKKRICFS